MQAHSANHVAFNLAMVEVLKDEGLKNKLQEKSYEDLERLAEENLSILEHFKIDKVKDSLVKNLWKKYITNTNNLNNSIQILNKLFNITNNPNYLNELGYVYHYQSKQFKKAEKAYLKALDFNKNAVNNWYSLGLLYQYELDEFDKAKEAYFNYLAKNKNKPFVFVHLGNLYIDNNQFDEAEKVYLDGIQIDNSFGDLWNELGNLYQDYLKKYTKAEKAYFRAIELKNNDNYPKHNLVFLHRDKMKNLDKAKEIFQKITLDKTIEDCYLLQTVLFSLYEKNEGLAKTDFLKALIVIGQKIPNNTQDDWFRFAAVTTKLGYNQWLQNILKEQGYDIILAPYLVAIKAINEKDEAGYLNSKAVEIREPAKKIMEMIRRYMD
ncbi:MAG: tetratricopeptide repeat protein [Saprospiraceae bacterium]